MMHNAFQPPPRLTGSVENQLQQLHRYLYGLAEQLQNTFDSMEQSNEKNQQTGMMAKEASR